MTTAKNKRWDDTSKPDIELPDLLGTVRRSPDGACLAVLWPSPPHPGRWMVTDRWGSVGYERNRVVADWPIVGAVPCSPAAGMELSAPGASALAQQADRRRTEGM